MAQIGRAAAPPRPTDTVTVYPPSDYAMRHSRRVNKGKIDEIPGIVIAIVSSIYGAGGYPLTRDAGGAWVMQSKYLRHKIRVDDGDEPRFADLVSYIREPDGWYNPDFPVCARRVRLIIPRGGYRA